MKPKFSCDAGSLILFASLALSGCMAAPLLATLIPAGTSAVGAYNLTYGDNAVTVTFEPGGEEKVKKHFSGVNRLAILSFGPAATAFADVYERAGKQASISGIRESPMGMSLSQARTAMQASCTKEIDAAIFERMGERDRGSVFGMFIGRADVKFAGELYVYNCGTSSFDSTKVTVEYNAAAKTGGDKPTQIISASLALKILDITTNKR